MKGKLFAVSDLHVAYDANRAITGGLVPGSDEDRLVVAGGVAGRHSYVADVQDVQDVGWALGPPSGRRPPRSPLRQTLPLPWQETRSCGPAASPSRAARLPGSAQ